MARFTLMNGSYMPQQQFATQARTVTPTSLEAVVQRLIPSAVLAPSAHNTQPWRFRVSGNSLEFFVDGARHLEISDPTHRQLFISLGCSIANAAVAARYFGYEPSVEYFPAGESPDQPVARVAITDAQRIEASETVHELFSAIEQRHTDRTLYSAEPLTADERAQLPTRAAGGVVLIEDRDTIAALARLTGQATEATLSRPDFKTELSHWVRHNWTRQPDGMPGYAMGMPAPVSLLAPLMVRFAPIHRQEGPKTKLQIESASAVAVFVSDADTPRDWLASGYKLEMLWLEATAAGLAAAPLVAAVEAGEHIRHQVQQCINTTALPQSILRLGHSRAGRLRATPRRSLEDCLR